jgi:hypothetical protein
MELLPEQKSSHEEVGYIAKSETGGQQCGNCQNLVLPSGKLKGETVRCRTVKSPIAIGGWCKRWEDRG